MTQKRWRHALRFAAAVCFAFCGSCADHGTTFPDIDRSKLLITLERGACFGSCPSYRVSIDGEGRVVFSSEAGPEDPVSELHRQFLMSPSILVPGEHQARVDRASVDALVQQFRDARFFQLRDQYRAQITDHPTYVVTIRTGNGDKRVTDYVGQSVGMPAAVTELENAIDRVAGADRWVTGGYGLIEWLSQNSFDFRSREAALLALKGVDRADERTILGLVDNGAPLDVKGPLDPPQPVGSALLEGAIRKGRLELFKNLVTRDWLKRLGPEKAGEAFARSAAGCVPAFVDTYADAGLAVDAVTNDKDEDTAGRTALGVLPMSFDCEAESARRATAARLLARGANPNHRDHQGATPIFGVEDLGLLNLLLASGADATVKDRKGGSAIFSSWTDEIVLRLLQAGASADGRYYDGLTLREQMRERPMPNVARWLAAHEMVAGTR